MVCLLQWVLRALGNDRKTVKKTVNLAPGKDKSKKKLKLLRLASWNVRTLCPGHSDDPQQIDDTKKTEIINRELKRLNIDIATLQETRLPPKGSLRQQDYTFF